MTGGIYFGPPAWVPERLIDVGPAWKGTRALVLPPRVPRTRADLEALLAAAQIGRTSPWLPGLGEQLAALGSAAAPALVLNFLPPEPESGLVYGLLGPERASTLAVAAAVRQCVPARRLLAVVDRALPGRRQVVRALSAMGYQTRAVLNQYPLADPTVLLRVLLASRLPPEAMPTTVGALMVDPVTLWALGRAAAGKGLAARPVEVFAFKRAPMWALAPLGMPADWLLAALDIAPTRRECIRNGMMAGARIDLETETITATTESLALRPPPRMESAGPCIQCGWCVDHCPTELNPVRLYDLARAGGARAPEEAREAQHCIACGLCSYVCPTRLPLMPAIVELRGRLRAAAAAPEVRR